MSLVIRPASLADVYGITDVHCSDVKSWRKRVDGKEVEASYGEPSIEERFEHGGPWMSPETCAVHLNYLLTSGQRPIVAEAGGRVVGELELYVGEEAGRLGRTAYIDILIVHRDYRRRGIGGRLVERAAEIAEEEGCDTLSAWPEKAAVQFYRKQGMETAYRILHVAVDPQRLGHGQEVEVAELPRDYGAVSSWTFASRRILSAYAAWLKGRWSYALSTRPRRYAGLLAKPEAAFIVENWRRSGEARADLWVRDRENAPEALEALCSLCRGWGLSTLHLFIDEELYRASFPRSGAKILGEELLLARSLGRR